MKLDRNSTKDGKGKYILINLRKLPRRPVNAMDLIQLLVSHLDAIEFGEPNSPEEFFPIKLKDAFANAALAAYADAARLHDPEYAREVLELADRAGPYNPLCKMPD